MFEPFFGSHFFKLANQHALKAQDYDAPFAIDLLQQACDYAKQAIMEMDTIKQLSTFQAKYLKLEAKSRLKLWESKLVKLTQKQWDTIWR